VSVNSTVYDVQVRYALDDRASQSLAHLGSNAESAEKSVGGLKESLMGLAELFLAREAMHFGKEFFIDANAEMQNLKMGMSSVAAFQLQVPFDKASASTDKLITGWQQFSKQTTLTTKQIVEFGRSTMAGVFNAGQGGAQYDAFVKRASVVGNIMSQGHAGGLQYAAVEFNEALMGNVRKTQMLNQQLLGPVMRRMGKDVEDFNKESAQRRFELMMQAINDPAWEAAIAKQKESFAGVTSTLKDNIEIALRDVGLPLFQEVTKEVQKWNQWIEANPKAIEDFGHKFATALVDGFHAVRDAVGFIVDNKETLIRLAELWLASKAVGLAGDVASGVGGLVRSGAGMLGKGAALGQGVGLLGRGAMSMEGTLLASEGVGALAVGAEGAAGTLATVAGLAGPIGLVVAALGGFYLALKVGDAQDGSSAQKEKQYQQLESTVLDMGPGADKDETIGAVFEWAKAHGVLVKDGDNEGLNKKGLYEELIRLGESDSTKIDKTVEMVDRVLGSMSWEEWDKRLGRIEKPKEEGDPLKGAKTRDAKNVNVTIHRIEVASPDPDRFAFNFNRAMSRIAVNKTQAVDTLRGGA
jgi:hypothetical protein